MKRVRSEINIFEGYEMSVGNQKRVSVKPSDFERIRVIGTGHYATVYLVKKKSNSKYYAMKVMTKKKILEGNDVDNIKTERKLLEAFQHPFVVNLHYAFRTEKKLFFVMDFVQGGELFTHLKKSQRFKERRAMIYAAEIFLALQYLHKHNIIYRDLKPENVLIDGEGHVKLCDFGLSKILESKREKTWTWCGTPEYLAPEILQECEDEGYGIAIDWWAFGVLLYEMLVGITPFYNRDVNRMYESIVFDEVVFPHRSQARVSKDAKDLILRLLHKKPSQRLGTKDSMEIKNHKFFQFVPWKKVMEKKVKPQFIPTLNGPEDLQYIDREFLDQPLPQNDSLSEKDSKGKNSSSSKSSNSNSSSNKSSRNEPFSLSNYHSQMFVDERGEKDEFLGFSFSSSIQEREIMEKSLKDNEKKSNKKEKGRKILF